MRRCSGRTQGTKGGNSNLKKQEIRSGMGFEGRGGLGMRKRTSFSRQPQGRSSLQCERLQKWLEKNKRGNDFLVQWNRKRESKTKKLHLGVKIFQGVKAKDHSCKEVMGIAPIVEKK